MAHKRQPEKLWITVRFTIKLP